MYCNQTEDTRKRTQGFPEKKMPDLIVQLPRGVGDEENGKQRDDQVADGSHMGTCGHILADNRHKTADDGADHGMQESNGHHECKVILHFGNTVIQV